jgi:hypothetical protein
MSFVERELPPGELTKHEAWEEFKNFGVQWSKLVAWSWTNLNDAGPEEPTLRKYFIRRLQRQAQDIESFAKCTTPSDVLVRMEKFSGAIKSMLLGEPQAPFQEGTETIAASTLTLSDVLKKYTSQHLMTSRDGSVKALFKESFNVRVITDSFVGRVTYAQCKDAESPPEGKYILELAYPPRPVFSSATLEEVMLNIWVKSDDVTPISYASPPSCYIPWSAS